MPTRTIAYLRVSTDKQADRGVSLDAQRAKLKAYAELYELDLVEVVVDTGPECEVAGPPGLAACVGDAQGRPGGAVAGGEAGPAHP